MTTKKGVVTEVVDGVVREHSEEEPVYEQPEELEPEEAAVRAAREAEIQEAERFNALRAQHDVLVLRLRQVTRDAETALRARDRAQMRQEAKREREMVERARSKVVDH